PPRSPLFPYTTLFRSLILAAWEEHCRREPPRGAERRRAERRTPDPGLRMLACVAAAPIGERQRPECRRDEQDRSLPEHDQLGRRSEEHTSELQSRENL